jgi:hypothetical protein
MKVYIGPYPDWEDIEDEQEISIEIDSYDTWSMDHTLAYIVVPMLKQLKETKHGAPFVDMDDRPEHLRTEEKDKYNTDIHHFEAWDWVMDEMIWAFEQKNEDWESQYYGEWIEDKTKTLGGYHKNIDWDGRKAHAERMQNGFELFGKYYQSLWD